MYCNKTYVKVRALSLSPALSKSYCTNVRPSPS